MSIKDLLSEPFVAIIKEVGTIVDNLHTSKEEKAEAHRKLIEVYAKHRDEAEKRAHIIEKSLLDTSRDRHQFDMVSDNQLSKNIRPAAFAGITGFVMLITILDSLSLVEGAPWVAFEVKQHWVNLWGGALMAFVVMYTGVRGWEKVTKMKTNSEVGTFDFESELAKATPSKKISAKYEGASELEKLR